MNNIKHPFIRIAGICAILAPLTLLLGDLLLFMGDFRFEWTIVLWLSFVLFVPAIFGLTYFIFSSGSRLAIVGGICAFFGAIAGASMQVLFRVYAVLGENDSQQAVQHLQNTGKLIASTQMIGIFFPIGLIILAVSLYRSRFLNPIASLLLIAGAFLFPVGRIGGFFIAVLSSDIVLVAAFGLIGWQILTRHEILAQAKTVERQEI